MTLKITRIDKTLPLPAYQTTGSVAFDLYSRIDLTVKPQTIVLIPTNLIVKVPTGYMLLVATRSSTPLKKGLASRNGIGIIDQDFCGPEDEMKLQVYNFTDSDAKVARGERLGQAVLVKIAKVDFKETAQTKKKSRGGFGSTG
ncbi:MAG: dUTPase [Candidatus Jacksonbacteria bacterium RIFOXYC2_FULL_44_29]|nr:MAG: Deoxyuridine 5'-triphosphate nucleotidohydrolase Dut [Parcubacteria group bacterium GW2011_GWC2_44_22]OGY75722.1 MAG: dUTPase [Candidatus Jacksonbacteria bacterium RIFOXYA2_FULL_43_12]OGY76288.1 MAG: dUTPase [Candidatus Jacksonbacteria bacterium RIFOXYB2_FULL_44_15]OGY78114.1 MAG: dUTPase [Candidatus Jacksonbacteria bacterium RIFOXYC2_FULL_44_29]OGY80977.1 MAG: dUTPase [Candidatus Jacksonbacteria bacterium RIFOXYD2_FULL_43_21]HBH46755.1 dUTP diphosphatase [Candidatus Jacksonbacteria ba